MCALGQFARLDDGFSFHLENDIETTSKHLYYFFKIDGVRYIYRCTCICILVCLKSCYTPQKLFMPHFCLSPSLTLYILSHMFSLSKSIRSEVSKIGRNRRSRNEIKQQKNKWMQIYQKENVRSRISRSRICRRMMRSQILDVDIELVDVRIE